MLITIEPGRPVFNLFDVFVGVGEVGFEMFSVHLILAAPFLANSWQYVEKHGSLRQRKWAIGRKECSYCTVECSTFFFQRLFIYFWDRERQSMNGGGAEREGDTESETGSRL